MKASELAAVLMQFPEHEVVMASDSEGNGYSPVAAIDEAHYLPETAWSGDLVDDEWLNEDGEVAGCYPAFFLWPTN